jgi:predicted oxidoreductase (fatty acid repression mutant protein)
MTFTVKYHELEHPRAQEVSVTVTTGETVASLIFFTGRRAVDQLVPEFQAYAKKYEPCFVYTDVPLSEVYVFLSQFGSGQTNARNHHKTAREI